MAFTIFSLLVQHEIIMVKNQHCLPFGIWDMIRTCGCDLIKSPCPFRQVVQCLLGLGKEHDMDIDGTDTLWGETGNHGSPAVVWASFLDVLAPDLTNCLKRTWDACILLFSHEASEI